MATIFSLKTDSAAVAALVSQLNALHDATVSASTDGYHRDITAVQGTGDFANPTSTALTVTAASATNLATSRALVANVRGVLAVHFADDSSHLVADTVNVGFESDGYFTDGYSVAYNLAEIVALANAIKVNFNAHLSQSGVHRKSDPNTVATADATDQTSVDTLLNALKAAVNLHMGSGPSVGRVKLV